MKIAAILLLSLASVGGTAAAPRADAPARVAAEMEAPLRQALVRQCGADARCALYAPTSLSNESAAVALQDVDCRVSNGKASARHCSFALHAPGRSNRLTCAVDFRREGSGRGITWSEFAREKSRRLYLPTSGRLAPRQSLGRSTLSCSAGLFEYVNQEARN